MHTRILVLQKKECTHCLKTVDGEMKSVLFEIFMQILCLTIRAFNENLRKANLCGFVILHNAVLANNRVGDGKIMKI